VLRAYRTRLVVVVTLAIVLSAALGCILARHGLAPVRVISAEPGRVNAEQLHARITNEARPAQLHQLADRFYRADPSRSSAGSSGLGFGSGALDPWTAWWLGWPCEHGR
jgi:hypothetical protein